MSLCDSKVLERWICLGLRRTSHLLPIAFQLKLWSASRLPLCQVDRRCSRSAATLPGRLPRVLNWVGRRDESVGRRDDPQNHSEASKAAAP
ncbi:hypothetical protein BHM03_00015681 [Ensete ventricosum]|nr:hypothetical protein BHM03_00015681 [Ensete ventricosum]